MNGLISFSLFPAPCLVEGKRIPAGHGDEYLEEGQEKRFSCGTFYRVTVKCINGDPQYGKCKCDQVSFRVIYPLFRPSNYLKYKTLGLVLLWENNQ